MAMFCRKCGTQLDEASAFCSRCGAAVGPFVAKAREDVSPKSRLATSLLAWFLGHFGVHRFYVGKIGTALVMLVLGIVSGVCWFGGFLGTLAAGGDHPIWGLLVIGGLLYFAVWVWSIIDFVIAVTGNFKDSQSRIIKRW
jgi:TM2 domain-containing membrane protein YozV